MSELILVVEDEQDLANVVDYNLRKEGFRTRIAGDGSRAMELANQEPLPDLVLLDLMLPDLSGTEICRRLRAQEKTRKIPVIMVTAKGEEVDRVVGFEVGADDYVVKPFSTRELILRIRAVLKRVGAEPRSEIDDALNHGALKVSISGHRVWVDDEEIMLTALEFKLLTTLMSRKGRVQTRTRLLDDVWDYDAEVTTRTVDTHVKRLRSKLGSASKYIETIRGVGYTIRERVEE